MEPGSSWASYGSSIKTIYIRYLKRMLQQPAATMNGEKILGDRLTFATGRQPSFLNGSGKVKKQKGRLLNKTLNLINSQVLVDGNPKLPIRFLQKKCKYIIQF